MLKRNKIIAGAMAMSIVMGAAYPKSAYADAPDFGYAIIENEPPHFAQDGNGRTWHYYNLQNGTIRIYGTEDAASYLEVPETLDGKTVTVIEHLIYNSADFYDVYHRKAPSDDYLKKVEIVTKVKLPKTIKMLERTFEYCKNLTDVEMPEDVTMSESEFADCPNVRINGHATDNNVPASSAVARLSVGWNQIGSNRYYLTDGESFKTGWMDLDGKRYYFYSKGQMAVSFINLGDGAVYYLDPTSGSNMGNLVTGWTKIDGSWYYFNVTGQGKKEKGYMQTGWFNNHGNWYYFYSDGTMATGFINLGGDAYYYLDESNSSSVGTMKTGWQKINGHWYYFNQNSSEGYVGMMKKGWQKIDGSWYYFYYGDGTMAHDTWIDGYYVNSSGAWS